MIQNTGNQPKKRPFITFNEAIVAIIIIFFTGFAFERFDLTPQVPLKQVLNAEVDAYAKEIQQLPISEIAGQIENNNGKPTMMVLYASWCGYCKILLPSIFALKNEGKTEGINLLFISLDKNLRKLSAYMLQRGYDRLYSPYMLENDGVDGLNNMLITKGAAYSGAIPYTVIFDSKGKVVFSMTGAANKRYLQDVVENAVSMNQQL